MDKCVLVVDDEISLCDLLESTLKTENFKVVKAYNGKDALEIIQTMSLDLILLDINLPDISGLDICKYINEHKQIPLILITAKTEIDDRLFGLEVGADDYITKPFHTREVLARCKALIRRAGNKQVVQVSNLITFGQLVLDPSKRTIQYGQIEIEFSTKEFDLLHYMSLNPHTVFSRDFLVEKVWGYDFVGDSRTVDVHVQRIRKKLKRYTQNSHYLQTVFGVGYKFVPQD